MSYNFSVNTNMGQGGILSPFPFCIYMEDLSNKLNKVNAGCIICSTLINHLMYGDDLSALGSFIYGFINDIICVHNMGYNSNTDYKTSIAPISSKQRAQWRTWYRDWANS